MSKPPQRIRQIGAGAEPQAQVTITRTADNPIWQECKRLGEELAVYGIPWGFGIQVNTGEMKPATLADAACVMLVAKGVCTQEEMDTVKFTILRDTMRLVLAAVKARAHGPGLVLPNGAPIPPDLLPKKMD